MLHHLFCLTNEVVFKLTILQCMYLNEGVILSSIKYSYLCTYTYVLELGTLHCCMHHEQSSRAHETYFNQVSIFALSKHASCKNLSWLAKYTICIPSPKLHFSWFARHSFFHNRIPHWSLFKMNTLKSLLISEACLHLQCLVE